MELLNKKIARNIYQKRGIEIKKKIEAERTQQKKVSPYIDLDTDVDLKPNIEEINQKYEKISEVFLSMAVGDFTKRLDVSNRKNLFNLLAISLNKVNEELAVGVSRNHIVEEALNLTEDLVLITDLKGIILFANSSALTILKRSKEDTLKLIIGNIFESRLQFGIDNADGKYIENKMVSLIPYNSSPIPMLLSVKKLSGVEGPDSYMYRAKTIKGE